MNGAYQIYVGYDVLKELNEIGFQRSLSAGPLSNVCNYVCNVCMYVCIYETPSNRNSRQVAEDDHVMFTYYNTRGCNTLGLRCAKVIQS